MSGFLLDTNVVSETMRRRPDPQVMAFLVQVDDLWLSSLVAHELEFGIQLMPSGQNKDRLATRTSRLLRQFEDRILPLDRSCAVWAARFRANAKRDGRSPDPMDMLIAGTAKAHDLAVATRNVGDYAHLDLDVVNPWSTS